MRPWYLGEPPPERQPDYSPDAGAEMEWHHKAQAVLGVLSARGSARVRDIARETGLGWRTVENTLRGLRRDRLVQARTPEEWVLDAHGLVGMVQRASHFENLAAQLTGRPRSARGQGDRP